MGMWSGNMQDGCQGLEVTWASGNVDGHVEWTCRTTVSSVE